VNRTVDRLVRIGKRTVVGSGIPAAADGAIIRRRFQLLPRHPHRHLVLAAPGGGNIGDQALLEALMENTEGALTLIVSGPTQLELPAAVQGRVELLEIPDLVYGSGAAHRTAVTRFGEALASAAHLSVVGADVMDGRYSLPASVRRSTLAAAAARAGVDTRVIGFSWSDQARTAARRALARAGRSGVRLMLRDPVSAERARRDGIGPVEEVADIVFAARTTDASAADELLNGVVGPVALVNVSGLIAGRVDQTAEYVTVVRALRSRGLHVVLLPHVSREKGDDVTACAAVAAQLGADGGVSVVTRLLTPAQVRGLTARVALTITGRMHLAVMSLMNGVPAITLATQGKVEGLMQLVGAPDLCIEPVVGFADRVVAVVDQVLPEDSATRSALHETLPGVVALARRNTDGLSETSFVEQDG
jgi:polysaccharide pyruvyl transferase WcaK-like protein